MKAANSEHQRKPKIVFFASHPTQFSAPMYRYFNLRFNVAVYFWKTADTGTLVDPELGHPPMWDVPLTDGYYHEVPSARKWRRVRDLARVLLDTTNDAVVISGWAENISRLLIAIGVAGRRPIAVHVDNPVWKLQPRTRGAVRSAFTRGILRSVPAFMVTGSLAQQYLMSLGIPRRRIFLLPYAVDNNTFARVAREARGCRGEIRRILGIPVFARVVLAVVKFVSREGILDLLQAFAKITEDVPSVWLLVVGDGPLREEVARFIDAYHLERVLCIGYQPYSVLPRLYAISDLFVHPAREESWGVSVNEAMACGVPVLASDRVGAAFDLVRDFQTGLIFRAGDASDLAAKLRVFLALSDEERSLMGVAAQAEVAKWGYEIVEDELRRLLSYFSRRPA